MKKNIAILIFNDVEVLDFAGPFEVFSATDEINDFSLFNVFTVGEHKTSVFAKNGLEVIPGYDIENCPPPEILVIPGGFGTRSLMKNAKMLSWIKETAAHCEVILSVCSGALLLAQIGLLRGLSATTHHEVLDELQTLAPDTKIYFDKRFVDNGRVITSAGVASGIDMCLYMVERMLGEPLAKKTANYIEYQYEPSVLN